MYTTEVSEREKILGYALSPIPNPAGKLPGEPEQVLAVAYKLDDNNLIVKKLNPMGGCRYWHLKRASDDWRTVSNVEPDPGSAIERARMV
jgi:hypothetical protein